MEVGRGGLTWVIIGYNPYHYDMVEVEAKNHLRLNYTAISYVYKVFKHLLMQWMAIWMYP